eukprot:2166429-Pyramimonas_sp.AAC.1
MLQMRHAWRSRPAMVQRGVRMGCPRVHPALADEGEGAATGAKPPPPMACPPKVKYCPGPLPL